MDELEIDRDALLQTFLAEAEETFVNMEQALVALESRPDDGQLLHGLFRNAHTLKGAAGLVGFDAVRDLSHDLENDPDILAMVGWAFSLAMAGNFPALVLGIHARQLALVFCLGLLFSPIGI